jgi:hypothetical protein
MAKANRKLLVISAAPADFEEIAGRAQREGRTRGEVLALLVREAREAREQQREYQDR